MVPRSRFGLPAGLVIVSNDTEAAIVSQKRQKNIPGFTPTNGNSDPLAGVNAVHDECEGESFSRANDQVDLTMSFSC